MVTAITFMGGYKIGDLLVEVSTLSRWSHCWAELDNGHIIDAMVGIGVSDRLPGRPRWSERVSIDSFPSSKRIALQEWLQSQIGKEYDYGGIIGWPLREWQAQNKWFCSELLAYGLVTSGCLPKFSKNLHHISPSRLRAELLKAI